MIENLRDGLLNWYQENGRNLPWRDTSDPYLIWLSEIILQQTRVNQGKPYYEKFVKNFPTVIHLARADEQAVLNLWQGLGYYSRARNLHAAAKYMADELGGKFPSTYKEILKLKGVGPYTAAAISSFAFNEAQAVLDGNVFRVLSRLFDIEDDIAASTSRPKFQLVATELLDKKDPSTFNQAIMDFGALQCAPKPICITCTLRDFCLSSKNGSVSERPVKLKKIKRKVRFFNYFLMSDKTSILLKKRIGKDIWLNLYELPLYEGSSVNDQDFESFIGDAKPILVAEKVHKLTHQDIVTKFYRVDELLNSREFLKISKNELNRYPLPRLIDEFLETHL